MLSVRREVRLNGAVSQVPAGTTSSTLRPDARTALIAAVKARVLSVTPSPTAPNDRMSSVLSRAGVGIFSWNSRHSVFEKPLYASASSGALHHI